MSKFKKLSTDDKTMLCSVINAYGLGQHPVASVDNLEFFKVRYIKECVQRAIPKLTTEGRYRMLVAVVRLGG